MPRRMTANKGAALERACIRRYVGRLRARCVRQGVTAAVAVLDELIAWLKGRAERASQRPGGLGRKRRPQR